MEVTTVMAARKDLRHSEEVRAKIQTSQLVNRLQQNANGEIDMTAGQLKAAEILLRKSLPDLSAVEVSGDADNPLAVVLGMRSELGTKLDRIANPRSAPGNQGSA
jgi:hypothetical protein